MQQPLIEYDYELAEAHLVNGKEVKATVKKYGHAVTLVMIFCIMATLFTVVWQAGLTHQEELKRDDLQADIMQLEEQHRLLRASIQKEKMPEAIVRHAVDDSLHFVSIDPSSLIVVAKE